MDLDNQTPDAAILDGRNEIDKVPLNILEQFSYHWRELYAQQRKLHDVSTKQIILGQLFTLIIIAAGSLFLYDNKNSLLLIGTALFIYPALAGLLTSNAAVLSTVLHHDIDSMELRRHRFLAILILLIKSLAVATLAGAVVGCITGAIGVFLLDTGFSDTLKLAVSSTLMAGSIGFPAVVIVTFLVRALKSNPDDVGAPIESTIFSTVTLIAIIYMSQILS